MADQQLVRPGPISGFPEWLPEVRVVELRWLDAIRESFERYGFCSVETPSVEALEVLQAKGETSNEVYTLTRLQQEPGERSGGDARLGLHFDLTVPFARYVAQHVNELVFPFKRYQIQRVWRGERPQEGRFREFTQCDVDVINPGQVPLHFDAELPRVVHEVLTRLDLPPWVLRVNNRKVLQGFYEGLGAADPVEVIRVVDRLDKVGVEGVRAMLRDRAGLTDRQAGACLDLATVRGDGPAATEAARSLAGTLGITSDVLSEGLEELALVLAWLEDLPAGSIVADLSVARGLDYYTGTVYEGSFTGWPEYGSICSGGRYDDLAGSFIRRDLPGVGMSIGLTRVFAKLVAEGLVTTGPSCPTDVLVVVPADDRRALAVDTAARLRRRGLNVEVYHQADKLAKQVRYASRKGIPHVWFPPFGEEGEHEVKDMASGEQGPGDPDAWQRP